MSATLGANVRERRHKAGLSQRDVAAAIGIGHPYVSKIEANRETPSPAVIMQLAELFGCHPADLVGDPDIDRARAWLRHSRRQMADHRDHEAEAVVAALVARMLHLEVPE